MGKIANGGASSRLSSRSAEIEGPKLNVNSTNCVVM